MDANSANIKFAQIEDMFIYFDLVFFLFPSSPQNHSLPFGSVI